MSLYNMVYGYSPACVLILPMLGRKAEEYPRFRNCFVTDDEKQIEIYTRVGGGNRNCGYGEDELYKDPNFVKTFDDPSDSTYGSYIFNVPDKWQEDFKHIVSGELEKVSDAYVECVKTMYPSLTAEVDKMFKRTVAEDNNDG